MLLSEFLEEAEKNNQNLSCLLPTTERGLWSMGQAGRYYYWTFSYAALHKASSLRIPKSYTNWVLWFRGCTVSITYNKLHAKWFQVESDIFLQLYFNNEKVGEVDFITPLTSTNDDFFPQVLVDVSPRPKSIKTSSYPNLQKLAYDGWMFGKLEDRWLVDYLFVEITKEDDVNFPLRLRLGYSSIGSSKENWVDETILYFEDSITISRTESSKIIALPLNPERELSKRAINKYVRNIIDHLENPNSNIEFPANYLPRNSLIHLHFLKYDSESSENPTGLIFYFLSSALELSQPKDGNIMQ